MTCISDFAPAVEVTPVRMPIRFAAVSRYQRFKTLAFYNPFVIITDQWDLKARRSNYNHKRKKNSIAIPDWLKIDRTHLASTSCLN